VVRDVSELEALDLAPRRRVEELRHHAGHRPPSPSRVGPVDPETSSSTIDRTLRPGLAVPRADRSEVTGGGRQG
jgi:hypothetical protein